MLKFMRVGKDFIPGSKLVIRLIVRGVPQKVDNENFYG